MPSGIFASNMSLKSKYIELSTAQLNAASSVATAQLVYVFREGNIFNFLANYSDSEVGILLAHSTVDDVADNNGRILWVAVAPNQVLNYSLNNPYGAIEGGTKMYVYRRGGAATTGKFVVALW